MKNTKDFHPLGHFGPRANQKLNLHANAMAVELLILLVEGIINHTGPRSRLSAFRVIFQKHPPLVTAKSPWHFSLVINELYSINEF